MLLLIHHFFELGERALLTDRWLIVIIIPRTFSIVLIFFILFRPVALIGRLLLVRALIYEFLFVGVDIIHEIGFGLHGQSQLDLVLSGGHWGPIVSPPTFSKRFS